MRVAVLIVSALLLSGCAVIPPIVSIAAWGLDGIVFVATDKTVTDHAISTVAQKDCAIFRGIMGKKVCRDYPPGSAPMIRVAAADLAPPPLGRGGRVNPAGARSAPLPPDNSSPTMLASAAAPATASGTSPRTPPKAAGPEEPLTLKVQRILVRLEQAERARRTAHSDLELAVARLDGGETRAVPRPQAVAPSPAWPAAPASPVAARPNLVSLSAAPAPPLRYVVLGSFADPANAARLVEEHASLWPFTAVAVVDGRRYRRVLAGPYPAAKASQILRRLKARGVAEAWTLTLAAPTTQRLANVLGLGTAANGGS